jgi:hypothetical protein
MRNRCVASETAGVRWQCVKRRCAVEATRLQLATAVPASCAASTRHHALRGQSANTSAASSAAGSGETLRMAPAFSPPWRRRPLAPPPPPSPMPPRPPPCPCRPRGSPRAWRRTCPAGAEGGGAAGAGVEGPGPEREGAHERPRMVPRRRPRTVWQPHSVAAAHGVAASHLAKGGGREAWRVAGPRAAGEHLQRGGGAARQQPGASSVPRRTGQRRWRRWRCPRAAPTGRRPGAGGCAA